MKKSKTISLLLALVLCFTLSLTAMAEGVDSIIEAAVETEGDIIDSSVTDEDIVPEEAEPTEADVSYFLSPDDPNEIIIYFDTDEEPREITKITAQDFASVDVPLLKREPSGTPAENTAELNYDRPERSKLTRSPSSYTEHFNFYIAATGHQALLPTYLNPGEYLQATLKSPNIANVDLDLFIVETDADGDIIYTNGKMNILSFGATAPYRQNYPALGVTKTIEETCGYVNETSQVQYVGVLTESYKGGSSSSPATLTVSFDEMNYGDVEEPNDSWEEALLLPDSDFSIDYMNLNVPNDSDLFIFDNTDGTYESMDIDINNPNVIAEAYQVEWDTNAMILLPQTGNKHIIIDDYIFIRIYNPDYVNAPATNATQDYSLTVTYNESEINKVVSARVTLDGDNGQWICEYPQGNKLNFKTVFKPTVTLYDAYNNPVEGIRVAMYWESRGWSSTASNHHGTIAPTNAITNANGSYTFNASIPTAYPLYRHTFGYPIQFTHVYDIMDFQLYIVDGPTITTDWVYHFYASQ